MGLFRSFRGTILVVSIAAGTPSMAAAQPSVAGATVPADLSVFGQELVLAGCGTREILWQDLYSLGLYLPQAVMAPSEILSPDTPKAVRLHVLYEGELPGSIPEEWREPLRRKLPPDLMDTVQAFFGRVESGDVATIAYTPTGGTVLQVNGETDTQVPGHQLVQALLELWIGAQPVSPDLRRDLLEGTC